MTRRWARPFSWPDRSNEYVRHLGLVHHQHLRQVSDGIAHVVDVERDEIGKHGNWHADAIERQLAHQEANEIRGAYTRAAEFWQERVRMMRWWAEELDRLKDIGRVMKMSA